MNEVQNIKTMNIFEKLSAITSKVSTVAKNLKVRVSATQQYNAVGERDVLDAVKPLEVEYRIYSYPYCREIIDTGVLNKKSENDSGKLFMRLKTIYRFVNIDNPLEYIDVTTYGDGVDSQDKACGKAMTYADKYALLKAYKIMTGEDPDQEGSENLNNYTSMKKAQLSFDMGFESEKTEKKFASEKQLSILREVYTGDNLKKLLEVNNIKRLEDISLEKASDLINKYFARKDGGNY